MAENRVAKRTLAFILSLFLFAVAFSPFAGAVRDIRDINRDLEEINRGQQQIEKQKGDLLAQVTDVELRLHALDKDIAALNDQLAVVNKAKANAEVELFRKQSELGKAEQKLERQKSLLDKRIIGIYKYGEVPYFDILTGSEGFDDFLSRVFYLKRIVSQDKRLLDRVKEVKDEVQQERDAVEARRQEVANSERAINDIKQPLDLKQREFQEERSYKLTLLEQIKTDEAIKERLIAALLAEQQAAANAGAGVGGGIAPNPRTGFIWPVYGAINSPYGYRIHPIFGDTRFHYGIDIDGSEGTPVVAPASGTVIVTEWNYWVGNSIKIDHGGGIHTRYVHLQSIMVSVGDKVNQGQVIGTVGNTGVLTTGPHLHFEVYNYNDPSRAGDPYYWTVDPLDWLPR